MNNTFEYDVAISFGWKDEDMANRLAALLEGRLSVFLYSKKQEKLAGTDGERTFNEVFGAKARLVVVLFREAWGKTPFTRFEETAIRNRAFNEGYDFTVFIPMDEAETQKVPAWLPKNRLYIGLHRWGIEAAAAVIEARFTELGGDVHEETIDDVAAKTARVLALKEKRKAYLNSYEGVIAQRSAYEALKADLLDSAEKLKGTLQSINLQTKVNGSPSGAILLLSNPAAMSVTWNLQYANTLTGSTLEAALWRGHPPWPGSMTFEKPIKLATLQFDPDLLEDGTAGWLLRGKGRPISNRAVLEEIMKLFLTKVQDV
ncbi:hypothetical protein [Cupriavidus numazuensis]|uniref:TIR domain-containing protein n=1 Tax=Cupriavidus numazuensis TaxID=221992 RepID=A0ABM8TT08_9BURK|nr:hypothetical protein [Cupriavidus numazuensis]CAG2159542.1 hypothetical protein LMG26411_06779 [Cupriavidus numazuensis]